ncbi:MAG: hypothetical protein Q9161_009727 [Pseudevernia consocians]
MSKPKGKVIEGVFAINKPPSISSAQAIRNLQYHFNPSALFAPWLANERFNREIEERTHRNRRKDKRVQVKIGHGGTLDPMATGVLIMGVGKGTKRLQGFLECTKTYEATIIFGAATDTYDVLGKILRRVKNAHVTREKVEKALDKFRGKIMQRPPIYSALRVQGKRLYEYAREGKEVPKEIEERPVEVKELEVVEWMEGGSHRYNFPQEEAEDEAKDLAAKVLHLGEAVATSENASQGQSMKEIASIGTKRKRSLDDGDSVLPNKKMEPRHDEESQCLMSGGLQSPDYSPKPIDIHSKQSSPPPVEGPPAVKLRMTVTSGFYVRSFSHDLGEVVGSLACMCELVRTRQGDFELGKNVVEYENLEKGEEVWSPMIEQLLAEWENSNKGIENVTDRSNGERRRRRRNSSSDA